MTGLWLVSSMVLFSGFVYSQNYPSRPIRLLTSEAGGGTDFASRIIAQGISGPLGQAVIVDNRGGGGNISGELVARATPDGYTLFYGNTTSIHPIFNRNNAVYAGREMLPVSRFESSAASFTRCASPPESVVADWPTWM